MSSFGAGTEITPDVARDLLHKLITESTRVQAAVTTSSGIVVTLAGVVKVDSDDGVWVTSGMEATTGHLRFTPASAVLRKYGDDRALQSVALGGPRFISALAFVFADGSHVTLLEFEQ